VACGDIDSFDCLLSVAKVRQNGAENGKYAVAISLGNKNFGMPGCNKMFEM
jgi:hypothetical protein